MQVYSIDDVTPVVHPTAFVHPTAVLIGDVIIGPECNVGPAASLRGDFGRLILERGANVQDACVMHGFPNTDTVVEENGHIGHGAVLHCCRIGRNSLVGMNAVVMDGAHIDPESIVAAGAFIKAGFSCEPRSMVVGSPGKVIRQVSDKELAWKSAGTHQYQLLSKCCMATLVRCEPLTEKEADRPSLPKAEIKPLYQTER